MNTVLLGVTPISGSAFHLGISVIAKGDSGNVQVHPVLMLFGKILQELGGSNGTGYWFATEIAHICHIRMQV